MLLTNATASRSDLKPSSPLPNGLRIQTSLAGKPRPIGCGQTRLSGNLIWYNDFKARTHTPPPAGKGGSETPPSPGTTTFKAAIIFGLCEGPIVSIGQVWNNRNITKLSKLNLTLFIGDYLQTAWSYVVTKHPDQAIPYRGLAYLAAGPFKLGTSDSLPNLNYEVLFTINNGIADQPDANPVDWFTALLTNPNYGVDFPIGSLGDWTSYSDYVCALGMVISDVLTQQSPLNTYLADVATATNSQFVWSSGKLNIVPYGDIVITGHGHTYTPPMAAVVALTDSDFISNTGGGGGSSSGALGANVPVIISRSRTADQVNAIKVEYLNRLNQYNPTVVEAKDEAGINLYGLRPADTKTQHYFCTLEAAMTSSQLQLGRQAVRNKLWFTLDQRFIFLDPMDIVSVTDLGIGLDDRWVRILEITEQSDYSLQILAEDFQQGTGLAPIIGNPTPTPLLNAPPGVTFIAESVREDSDIFTPSLALDPLGPNAWIMANGPGVALDQTTQTFGSISFWVDPIQLRADPANDYPLGVFQSFPNLAKSDDIGRRRISIHANNFTGSFPLTPFVIAMEFDWVAAGNGNSCDFSIPCLPMVCPPAGFGVMFVWDFRGDTWTGSVYIGGIDVTDYATQAVGCGYRVWESWGGGIDGPFTTTTTMGAGMLPDGQLFEIPAGAYAVGYPIPPLFPLQPVETFEWAISQLWVGPGQDTSAQWSAFFDGGGDPVPNTSGNQTGTVPSLYFPFDTSRLWDNAGRAGGTIDTQSGTITNAAVPGGALGLHFGPDLTGSTLSALGPLSGTNPSWGQVDVWVSTDGVGYSNVGTVTVSSILGVLAAGLGNSSDPDVFGVLRVYLGLTGDDEATLPSFSTAEADAGISLILVDNELMSYATVTLVAPRTYELTYLRRGLYGTLITPHDEGAMFAAVNRNAVLPVPYPVSLIGQFILVKLQGLNSTGTLQDDLSAVVARRYHLGGPPPPPAPASLVVNQPGGAGASLSLTWNPALSQGAIVYDVAYSQVATYDPTTASIGALSFGFSTYDPGVAAVAKVYSNIQPTTSTPNGIIVEVLYNQDASGAPFPSQVCISIKIHDDDEVGANALLWTASTMITPTFPLAVGFQWDGSGATWSAKIVVNGADVTDTVFQAANSNLNGVPGLTMGRAMIGTNSFPFENLGAVWIGAEDVSADPTVVVFDGRSYGQAQLWIGAGQSLDFTSAPTWALFFDGGNNPVPLGNRGEIPTGTIPVQYYPTDPSFPGQSNGQVGPLDVKVGGFAQDFNYLTPISGMRLGDSSAVGAAGGAVLDAPIFLTRGIAGTSFVVTGLAPGNYTFLVRSVDGINLVSQFTTFPFTVA